MLMFMTVSKLNLPSHNRLTQFIPVPRSDPVVTTTTSLLRRPDTEDNLLMLLLGSPGSVIGKWRRRKHETTCTTLETGPDRRPGQQTRPRLKRFMGNAFLPGIDGLVSCGYEVTGADKREQVCYVFYRSWGYWTRVFLFPDRVMYGGASLAWHDKLVLFGGHHLVGREKSVSRAIFVFTFHPVRGWLEDEVSHGSGDFDSLNSDDEDQAEEGSGYDGVDEGVNVNIQAVDNSYHVLTDYGPAAVHACAVSLHQTRQNVVFVVTGGQSVTGVTLDKVMRLELDNNHGREPRLGREREVLPSLRVARTRHGCTKVQRALESLDNTDEYFKFQTDIAGEDVIVVAGGQDERGSPVKEVEYLKIAENRKWRTLGRLSRPAENFPTLGRVLGRLVVVGGERQQDSDSDIIDIDNRDSKQVISLEVYDEDKSLFREAVISDNLSIAPTSVELHQYYGVMFPKSWCKMH